MSNECYYYMFAFDASNHPEKVNYIITYSNSKLRGKPGYAQLKAGSSNRVSKSPGGGCRPMY